MEDPGKLNAPASHGTYHLLLPHTKLTCHHLVIHSDFSSSLDILLLDTRSHTSVFLSKSLRIDWQTWTGLSPTIQRKPNPLSILSSSRRSESISRDCFTASSRKESQAQKTLVPDARSAPACVHHVAEPVSAKSDWLRISIPLEHSLTSLFRGGTESLRERTTQESRKNRSASKSVEHMKGLGCAAHAEGDTQVAGHNYSPRLLR